MPGAQIRRMRVARGWSQQELADRLGVTRQAVSAWESDSVLPSVPLLCRIADALACSTDLLLDRQHDYCISTAHLTAAQAQLLAATAREFAALNQINGS